MGESRKPTFYGRAVEDPSIVSQVGRLLAAEWDPSAEIRNAVGGAADFYEGEARTILGMLSADAGELEVQGYLRTREQAALGRTLHPVETRHAIAARAWRAARSLDR
jgi:hypothetical protein